MGKRKRTYIPKDFESDGTRGDTSANIYGSMLVSKAWQSLTKGAMALYVACKAQYYAEKDKPVPKYTVLSESEQARCFTMPMNKWRNKYGLFPSNTTFYKAMNELVKFGFVDIVENGKTTRTKNVYMFSDRWHKPPP